jgi:autotransporter-associated beta strand protein
MARHYSPYRLTVATLCVLVAVASSAQSIHGQTTYTFVTQNEPTTFVDWHDTDVWSPTGIPNAPGDAVIFNRPTVLPSVAFSVIVNQNTTVGSITVDNTGFNNNHNLILDIGGTLTFHATSGSAALTETIGGDSAGRLDIQPDIVLLSDLVSTQNNRANLNSSSFLRGLITGSSDRTFTKEGAATLQMESHGGSGFQGQYVINEGGIRFTGSSNISHSTGVTVNPGGQFQLNADDGGPEFHDWSLADGAVLNLNGLGRAGLAGALRFQGAGSQDPRHSNFHSPVVLQADSRIGLGPAAVTGELTNVVSGDGGLIKNGPGTLILSNAGNSYAGDTTIEAGGGTLSITNPIFADGADVYLPANAFLDLSFSGNDAIRSLFIDGEQQSSGLWGATGNLAAEFVTDRITGSGLLEVIAGPGLAGDYNDDGVVDAADYVVWRKSPGDNGGDPDGYNIWVSNFGNNSGGGSSELAAIPEPSTTLLTALAIVGLLAFAKNR